MDYSSRGFPSSSADESLKQRIRSANCFSCCFRGAAARDPAAEGPPPPSLLRSSSAWVRSKAQELPEFKEKCRSLVSRIRSSRGRLNGDFRYDPLSYALNFDEGPDDTDEDGKTSPVDYRYRSFSSRLPPTPPQPVVARLEQQRIACN